MDKTAGFRAGRNDNNTGIAGLFPLILNYFEALAAPAPGMLDRSRVNWSI